MENRPVLWDTRCKAYSNKVLRGRAWKEICGIFVSSFNEMNSLEKNKAVVEMQRKWKSFRDSFRREISKTKKGPAAETGRKEYMYFKQLLFLMPICETKPEGAEDGEKEESSSQTANVEDESSSTPTASQNRPATCNKRKCASVSSEEQLLFKTLQKLETRTSEKENDPDRHFLLSLLPHFKSVPDSLKLDVQMEFLDILKRYTQHEPPLFISYPQTSPTSAESSPDISTHQDQQTYTIQVKQE